MDGWHLERNLVKLVLNLDRKGSEQFANNLKQMNMTSALLFPGFDGFAISLRELILHYENLARHRTGGAGSTVPMWPCFVKAPTTKAFAIEAAERLKRKLPHSAIVVRDLQSGEATAVEYKPDLGSRSRRTAMTQKPKPPRPPKPPAPPPPEPLPPAA